MRCLVVGGAGYLGGALADLLLQFRVYDNLTYEDVYLKDVPFVLGDVRDHKKLKEQLKWADCVIWLAAIVGDGACALNPTVATEVNQESVKWLADNFDGRIIFVSTCSVYGARGGDLTEISATRPLSVYAATKLKAEEYLKGKNAIIFRLGTLFGIGDRHSRIRLDLVVNTLTARAVSQGKLTVFGGEQYRPLLHVKDAAQAIADNVHTKHTGIFNLRYSNMKIAQLANIINYHVPCEIETVQTAFEDARNYRVSTRKARDTFDFSPKHSINDGIMEVAKLVQEGRIKDLNNPRFSNQLFLEVFPWK